MINIAITDIAWAAGFFEGEGYIGVLKSKRKSGSYSYSLRATIRQVNYAPIEKFITLFGHLGGSVHKGDWNGYSGFHRPIYSWFISAQPAVEFLKILYPYLLSKRDQADIAFKFQENIKPLGTYGFRKSKLSQEEIDFREECFIRLKELKWKT